MQKDLNQIAGRAIDLAERAIHASLEEQDPVRLAILHHLVVVWRDAQAVRALCESGLSDVSLLPLRRAWESVLRLQFILLEPDTRARAFLEESWVLDTHLLKAAVSEPAATRGPISTAVSSDPRFQSRRADLKQAGSCVSGEARARADQDVRPRDLWSIRFMAEKLHRLEEYTFLYSFLCERTHGALNAAKDLLVQGDGGELRVAPQDYGAMSTAMAAAYLLYATGEMLQHTQSPDREECQRLLDLLSDRDQN